MNLDTITLRISQKETQQITTLLLQRYLAFATEGFFEINYYRQDYYNDDFNRIDNQFSIEVAVSKRLYKILYLDLGYVHVSNLSDTDFPPPNPFEYDRDIFSVTLTARF